MSDDNNGREADRYMTTEDFAAVARTNPATVRYWRHVGRGPHGFKLGRRVLYEANEVHEWIESQRAAQQSGRPA